MGDYYRRDRYDDDRRYYRDDHDRRYDRYNDRERDDRYPPTHRRSPDLYYDRDRDRGDSSYRERERDRSWERDRDDRDRYHDYPPRDHSRSAGRDEFVERSRSPPEERDLEPQHPPTGPRSDKNRGPHDVHYDAGKPNSHLIFRGLDKDIAETHLQQFLYNQGAAVESVIIIRDKETRESRGFAFVKFFATEAAQDYMEKYYPVVVMGENKVKIAYSLGRGDEDNGWTCDKVDLIIHLVLWSIFLDEKLVIDAASLGAVEHTTAAVLTVDAIPSSPPKSLTQKPWVYNDGTGDIGDIPSQFLLIRNLDTMIQEESIAKGLAKLETPVKRILLIRDRKTKISWGFAFVEYPDSSLAKKAFEKYEAYKAFKIEKSKVKMSYCHPGVFVPVYDDAVKYAFKTAGGIPIAYWDEHGYASEWVPPSEEKPVDEEIAKFQNELKAAEAAHAAAASIISEPVIHVKPVENDSSKRESTASSDQQKKKRKVETVTVSAKAPSAQLEKWANKREELKSTTVEAESTSVSEFADLNQMCCLLCKRKFKTVEEIQRHERLSQLHKTNLADDAVRNACLETIGKQQTESAYRDRARERRIQFNQPHHPDLPHPNPRIAAKQAAVKAAAKQPSPEPEPVPNKGAKLLAAMGWSEGTGLGAEGTGIVEPVKAQSYAEGVGLGAGTAKVVGEDIGGKDDDGSYRAYVNKVKAVARGRYENELSGDR